MAFSTIPAAWVGREPPDIAAGLADALVGSLHLDFAFVRLCDPKGGTAVEVTRGNAWKSFPEWLQRHRVSVRQFAHREIIPDVGGAEPCRGVVIPIGVNAEGGMVAAASGRTDFPTEIDQLLLSVASNHAATAFQNARLIHERTRAEEELRQARNELEIKVAQRTKQLTGVNEELRKENTERKQAEEAARAAKARFEGIVEIAQDAIISVDSDQRIILFNQGAEKVFGYTQAEAIGRSLDLLLPRRFEDAHRKHIEDFARSRDVARTIWQRREVSGRRKDGSEFPAEASISKLDLGSELVFTVILRDITERKRAEESLRSVQMELAHVTRVTTLGEMAASIAHELNQPLAAVVINASACLRWLVAHNLEEAQRSAKLIRADGHRAGEIINRIRALAKKAPPPMDWLDINETILEVIALARSEAQKNRVSLQTKLSSDLPLVMGDRVELQQVILNLIINAIEAMSGVGDNPRELLVRSEKDESQGVLVAVRDSGPGLDPGNLDRLFHAFFTTKSQGMGMGLAISRSIVEAHGGRLWATTNAPRGAVFQFTLPTAGESAS